MEQKFNYFLGVDISKKTFDVTISLPDKNYKKFDNNLKGCKAFLKWLNKLNVDLDSLLVCMENTGIYHRLLASFLTSENIFTWVENASQIKWSIGIQRGKNDKVDSKRIMNYAKRHFDKSKTYVEKEKDLLQIADLLGVRRRMKDCLKSLNVPIKELMAAGLKDQAKDLEKATAKSIKVLKQEVDKVENEIQSVIKKNKNLNELYKYVTSVKSVGFVAASHLLVYTNGFTKFNSAKQIASYSGIAPFEYSSGTSIKGRTRVHHMANKRLKTVLHMCAISSVANNEEMKVYFKRKVDEGKNKMLVLNAIRNKVLARIFSCVKNKRMYEPYLV
ncbi:IS110 family transposase [Saprospiraceae bacterium]|nr:IS110 family transposase [Saprospiraceae bacterium]